MPATEEEGHDERKRSARCRCTPHEEQTPFHAGVLDVITVGELLLGFRLVKRVAVGDGDPGKQEGDEAESGDHVPHTGLGLDDVAG